MRTPHAMAGRGCPGGRERVAAPSWGAPATPSGWLYAASTPVVDEQLAVRPVGRCVWTRWFWEQDALQCEGGAWGEPAACQRVGILIAAAIVVCVIPKMVSRSQPPWKLGWEGGHVSSEVCIAGIAPWDIPPLKASKLDSSWTDTPAEREAREHQKRVADLMGYEMGPNGDATKQQIQLHGVDPSIQPRHDSKKAAEADAFIQARHTAIWPRCRPLRTALSSATAVAHCFAGHSPLSACVCLFSWWLAVSPGRVMVRRSPQAFNAKHRSKSLMEIHREKQQAAAKKREVAAKKARKKHKRGNVPAPKKRHIPKWDRDRDMGLLGGRRIDSKSLQKTVREASMMKLNFTSSGGRF